jgi:hypothetical protein
MKQLLHATRAQPGTIMLDAHHWDAGSTTHPLHEQGLGAVQASQVSLQHTAQQQARHGTARLAVQMGMQSTAW